MWEFIEKVPINRESKVFETAVEIDRASHISPKREEVHSREAIIEETPQQKGRKAYSPVEIVIKTPGSPDKPGLLV